jgi:hypothetical protein
MKTILTAIVLGGLTVIAATAQQQPHYLITDLGPVGNPFAQATGIDNRGLISGLHPQPGFYGTTRFPPKTPGGMAASRDVGRDSRNFRGIEGV